MPPSKFKISQKNVIKKLCNTKNWLVTHEKNKNAEKSIKYPPVHDIFKNMPPLQTVLSNNEHTYQNIDYNTKDVKNSYSIEENSKLANGRDEYQHATNEETKNTYHEIDDNYENIYMNTSSLESNITVIEIPNNDSLDNQTLTENSLLDSKLKMVIDNFDKILDEYSAPPIVKKEKPKLIKSKTCSIIESKCILKQKIRKTELAASKSMDTASMGAKTKSLQDICLSDVELSIFVSNKPKKLAPTKTETLKTDTPPEPTKRKKHIQAAKALEAIKLAAERLITSTPAPKDNIVRNTNGEGKVADVIKKLNSLVDNEDLSPIKKPIRKSLLSNFEEDRSIGVVEETAYIQKIPKDANLEKLDDINSCQFIPISKSPKEESCNDSTKDMTILDHTILHRSIGNIERSDYVKETMSNHPSDHTNHQKNIEITEENSEKIMKDQLCESQKDLLAYSSQQSNRIVDRNLYNQKITMGDDASNKINSLKHPHLQRSVGIEAGGSFIQRKNRTCDGILNKIDSSSHSRSNEVLDEIQKISNDYVDEDSSNRINSSNYRHLQKSVDGIQNVSCNPVDMKSIDFANKESLGAQNISDDLSSLLDINKRLSLKKLSISNDALHRISKPLSLQNSYDSSVSNTNSLKKSAKRSGIPRSISCLDVSQKKLSVSRIPVSLNKSFPSTPNGLNVDRNLSSTRNLTLPKAPAHQGFAARPRNSALARSMINLRTDTAKKDVAPRLSIRSDYNKPLPKLDQTKKPPRPPSKISPLVKKSDTMDNCINIGHKLLHRVENLNTKNNSIHKPVKKLGDRTDLVYARRALVKPILVKDVPNNPLVEDCLTIKDDHKYGSVTNKLQTFPFRQELKSNETNEIANLVTNGENDEALNHKFPNNTFGMRKGAYEPKFAENLKSPTPMRAKEFPKENRLGEIEVGLETAKEILVAIQNNHESPPTQRLPKTIETDETIKQTYDFITKVQMQELALQIEPAKSVSLTYSAVQKSANPFTDTVNDISASDLRLNQLNTSNNDSGIILDFRVANKIKDYSSDDNSDDSGNIPDCCDKVYSSAESLADSLNNKVCPTSGIEDVQIKAVSKNNEQIFFRSSVLTQLEAQRDERLAGMVVNLQAHCRGYLARKKMGHRKLQDLAVRCLQRNVRKFMLVRDWPWWRLLVRVTPLLNVHRTEDELRQKTEELELLKAKLEKIETERISYKHENDKLEAKLSEMTADLAEEHSTSILATERLDAETSERIRMERELVETQQKNKSLQQSSERLEMELMYARSDLNGISEEDEDGEGDGVYKQRYERAVRELDFTKRRLQQQHEDDMEQLVGLKKQLEKKLGDAYEEVEEQRQVVGQWKRKVQKLNGEMNDLKLLLEEQNARNNLLEKKQRKFDSETQLLQDELRQDRQAKDRLGREKELVIAEKFTLESNLADVRLELEMKEEKLLSLQRELDELTYGGKTEEEVTILRKQKIDCERRLHDQEEELDELAGQVQLLEQAKLKLEMGLEQMRKTSKKEAQQHDEELEEVRCNSQKKLKTLEAQLENEHEDRTILLREKHELERRLVAAMESDHNEKACDEALLQRLKRDLKRTKALLRDTQTQLERQKAESPGKALIRQLRNQLEDIECARTIAVKAKQSLEAELSETQAFLEESNRMRSDAEDKLNSMSRERSDLQTQLEENEEELAEVLKKYKSAVSQMSLDQIALQEQVSLVSELEIERNQLKDQLSDLTTKLESVESMGDASSNLLVKRTELKVKELESKLDLEQTTKSRLEVQIARLKEAVDKLQVDISSARAKEQQSLEQIRKLQRSLRELKDEHNSSLAKEGEAILKRKEFEKKCETVEAEAATARADLRLALKRIEDLQSAIQGDLDDDSIENSDSDHDSYSSDDSVNTFLATHKIVGKTDRSNDNGKRLSTTSRSSTSSNLGKDGSYA